MERSPRLVVAAYPRHDRSHVGRREYGRALAVVPERVPVRTLHMFRLRALAAPWKGYHLRWEVNGIMRNNVDIWTTDNICDNIRKYVWFECFRRL